MPVSYCMSIIHMPSIADTLIYFIFLIAPQLLGTSLPYIANMKIIIDVWIQFKDNICAPVANTTINKTQGHFSSISGPKIRTKAYIQIPFFAGVPKNLVIQYIIILGVIFLYTLFCMSQQFVRSHMKICQFNLSYQRIVCKLSDITSYYTIKVVDVNNKQQWTLKWPQRDSTTDCCQMKFIIVYLKPLHPVA